MERDMDLIRQILFAVEGGAIGRVQIEQYDETAVTYHVRMLIEAGYLSGTHSRDSGGITANFSHMTWQGHDFIDAARDDERWKKAQSVVKEKGGSVAIDVLKQLLSSMVKQAIGLG